MNCNGATDCFSRTSPAPRPVKDDWSPDKEDHTKKHSKTDSEAQEGNFDFGAKLDDGSENIKKLTTEGGTSGDKKKIRFRPRKSHLTQLLMHTQVKFMKACQYFCSCCRSSGLCRSLVMFSQCFLPEMRSRREVNMG